MKDERAEQAIFDEILAFTLTWNKADADKAASFYTDDAVRVGAFGDIQHGREEIKAAYKELFARTLRGAGISQERGTVRMLSPEFAVWQGGIEVTTPDGRAMRGHVVQVMQKVGNRWLVLEAHPKFFPPPPPRS